MPVGSGVVSIDSPLIRKKWIREGMVQKASLSFWSQFTGTTKDAIVYQAKNLNAGEGHTVVFDFDGNLSQRAIKGKNTATGKGEKKRKFSDKLTVNKYRLVVDNGDDFDGVNIGDLSINQHADSRSRLSDLFVRFKDQLLYDAAQGVNGQSPSHIIDLNATFGYNELLQIEKTIGTSVGYSTGGVRRPLAPYRTSDGKSIWLFIVDQAMATKLKQSVGYQNIVVQGDIRGQNNRAISGVIGKVGKLVIVEAETFFGESDAGSLLPETSDIEVAGLRQYDATHTAWTGQPGFDYTATLHSRGLVLGAGALQLAFGKMPDYKYEEADFGSTSESCLEVWMEGKKTKLVAENEDYKGAKIANIDWGVVAVDVEI